MSLLSLCFPLFVSSFSPPFFHTLPSSFLHLAHSLIAGEQECESRKILEHVFNEFPRAFGWFPECLFLSPEVCRLAERIASVMI